MILAIIIVTMLSALVAAVLGPIGTSAKVTNLYALQRKALFVADAAAERAKLYMTLPGAVAADGTSESVLQAVSAGLWEPVSITDNGGTDKPGVTFPTIDMVDGSGNPVFDLTAADSKFPPVPGMPEARYIAYTAETDSGCAISYVSAEYEGEVVNMRISYRRHLASELPHESYFHAIYAANNQGLDYTFMMESETHTETQTLYVTREPIPDDPSESSNGVIMARALNGTGYGKGHLAFNIPSGSIVNPRLRMYVHNTPHGGTDVNIHTINKNSMTHGYEEASQFGEVIGELTVENGMKHHYVEFPLSQSVVDLYRGQTLYVAMSIDGSESPSGTKDVLFKSKGGSEPMFVYDVTTEVNDGSDIVAGDIYINGNADIESGDVVGTTKATGTVIGDGSGEELTGVDPIDPPLLQKEGSWYASLGVGTNGSIADPENVNSNVVFDGSDGAVDNIIAGIIVPHTMTGENQEYMDDNATSPVTYVLDSNIGVQAGSGDPTYDYATDSVIVTVPDEFNNKAIYIPGDFWVDILNPTDIDFKTASGESVNLTFIVEGNIYMTDGINTDVHPEAVGGGVISMIALKRSDTSGGDIFYGDPAAHGVIDPIKAFLYAENNFLWFQDAQGAGEFRIEGNMTASGIIDFTNRQEGDSFVPIEVNFDPTILDPEVRAKLPCLPPGGEDIIVPGTPYIPGPCQHL